MANDEHDDDNQHDSQDLFALRSLRNSSHQDDTRGHQNDGWYENHDQSRPQHATK